MNDDDDDEEDLTKEGLRIASSTAYKAHSWRGDHPMKSSNYFEHEAKAGKKRLDDQQQQQISMPFR